MLFSEFQNVLSGDLFLVQDTSVERFSVDTRTLLGSGNEVFFALVGKRDGHDFVKRALEKGVRNFVLQKHIDLHGANVLLVEDTTDALQHLAKHHRAQFNIPIIAITGSNGKTTVKEWLSTILSQKYLNVKSPKSYNSQIGVPLSLLEMRNTHEAGIFEAGISQREEMANLEKQVMPTLGIFTNLGEAHDQGFASKEEKLTEKLLLFQSADKVVYRAAQAYSQKTKEILGKKSITWGTEADADYLVAWEANQIKVSSYSFKVNLDGEMQFENLTHCIVMALVMGLSESEIQDGLDSVKPIQMRLELKKGINNCYILDDSYNNDEVGLRVALDYLSFHNENEKRTLILSDLLHSGKPDSQLYAEIGQLLNEKKVDRLISVGDRIAKSLSDFKGLVSNFRDTNHLLDSLPVFKDEMILVKGARDFELERVVKRLELTSHGTVLEVNFEALQENLNAYRSLLNSNTKIMTMVKANAYGSGLLEVANFLQHQGVDLLGVAYVNEAIQLRKNGIDIPIMIMNPHIESFDDFERYDLQAEIYGFSHLKRLLRDTKNHPRIHLKLETGMHRLGFSHEEIASLITFLQQHPDLRVEGIFSHFASADLPEHDEFTRSQAETFNDSYAEITTALGYTPLKHICNSSGIVRWPEYHFDMVRLGIGLHGYDPTGRLSLKNTSQLKSIVSQVQTLKKGDTVGYGRKGIITRDSRIAVIPIGYEDGYQRVFGNGRGKMVVNNQLCSTVGNICMDMTMLDVTDVEVNEGDEVIIFGAQPSINDLASWGSTIPYEILTNVSNRVKRVFISE
ncbi:MAG: bifunctional UDP-N-acetylmuramoyl-tripeptide:D-alanyl-D-alanine ligase/alanine racemase [Ekhidna sp.]|nr:bifunctional UDP-N-acetylmuramoyl-tripeptide:D-alanyl-D-alanine ligase/alanine racemase [Ekhidna sp.]